MEGCQCDDGAFPRAIATIERAAPDLVLLDVGLTGIEGFEGFEVLHPIIGEQLCGDLHSLAAVRPIVRHHIETLMFEQGSRAGCSAGRTPTNF